MTMRGNSSRERRDVKEVERRAKMSERRGNEKRRIDTYRDC